MTDLRRSIISAIIGMTIFFNIERLDFGEENVVDIASFVYVLGLIAFISIVAIPALWRFRISTLIMLWAGIYLLSKLSATILFNERPIVGGVYTYLSITELALLLLIVGLVYKIAVALKGFEDAVRKVTFANPQTRVRELDEGDDAIQVEMFRSRHNHHPLSLILVEPNPESIQTTFHQLIQEAQRTMINSYVINSMAQTFGKYLRRTDLIFEQRDRGRFIVLCPETNTADAQLLVEYIQAVAAEQLGSSVTFGLATFPDEAVTFEELMHQAELHLQRQNGNDRM